VVSLDHLRPLRAPAGLCGSAVRLRVRLTYDYSAIPTRGAGDSCVSGWPLAARQDANSRYREATDASVRFPAGVLAFVANVSNSAARSRSSCTVKALKVLLDIRSRTLRRSPPGVGQPPE